MKDRNTQNTVDIRFKKMAGYCLLIASVLIVVVAIMHPIGGDIKHIVHLKSMLLQSHSLAIICLPFIGFGFFGLSSCLMTKSKLSVLALVISFFGLFSAMIAATINGLTLPAFASTYSQSKNQQEVLKIVITYGKFINIPMTYIFIVAFTFSVGLWSYLITKTNQISAWIGYFGLFIVLFGIVLLIWQFNFTSLFGLRSFLFGLIAWKILVAMSMLRKMYKKPVQ